MFVFKLLTRYLKQGKIHISRLEAFLNIE